jgi:hypothetical protein
LTEGGTIGQTLGAQIGGTSSDDEQSGFTSPFTQAQWQEFVFCAPAKIAAKTTRKKARVFI